MRKVVLQKEDFAMFHQDITPTDYEFYRTHSGAFKRMWQEQTRRFWTVFVKTFDHFVWNYGVMKDFPLKMDDVKTYIQEIVELIRGQFVDGNASSARGLINDCVIVARNRHYVGIIDKAPYAQNPFYMKETRESFRKLFGPPHSKSTIMKVICGLPVYVKFAGATVGVLRRWLVATDLDDADEYTREMYFVELAMLQSDEPSSSQDTSKSSKSSPRKTEKGQFSRELLDQYNIDELTIDLEELAPPKPLSLAPSSPSTNRATTSKDGTGDPEKKSSKSKEAAGKVDKKPDSVSDESKSKRKRRRRKKGAVEKSGDSEMSSKSDLEVALKNGGKQVSTSDKHLMGSEVTCEANEKASLPTATAAMGGDEVTGPPAETQTTGDDGKDGSSSSSSSSNGVKMDKECAPDLQNQDPLDASKKRLHECGFCHKEEVEPKTFKRCQRCRGKANPKYYCSRECQVGDWKAGHKTEHKDD